MILLFTVLILALIFKVGFIFLRIPFDLRNLLLPASQSLHEICLDQTLNFSSQSEAAAALVCGHQIDSIDLNSLFAASGLIHLLVVSGSHLLILSKGLDGIKCPRNFRALVLFLFVLVCEMNAPIFRSFVALVLTDVINSKKWLWTSNFKQWMTTLVCLLINPLWIFSISFQMSWLASLCLEITSNQDQESVMNKNILRSALISGSFIFIFGLLGFPSLWSPLISLAFSGILELILFPLAFAGCIFKPFAEIFDFLFGIITRFLDSFSPERNFLFFLERDTVTILNLLMIVVLLSIQLKLYKVKI